MARLPPARLFVSFLGVALLMGLRGSTGLALQAPAIDPWIARAPKLDVQSPRILDAPIQIELPKKDWTILPSSGSVLLLVVSKPGDAVVLVERSALRLALEPSDITDTFAQIEIDAIKERHPKTADVRSKILDLGNRRLVGIEYTRPGVLGTERVRQYSMPVGKFLYRLACISTAARFASYDPLFSHIAASFTVNE